MTTEPRAVATALSGPAFAPRSGRAAMHVADRHIERWAPEDGVARGVSRRPMRSLGFVDRLVAPWMETAQRSASLRLFTQYTHAGMPERAPSDATAVSWVFPRPWYQDELDWMAAARQAQRVQPAGSVLTTRGTYVPPAAPARREMAMPSALYEYVAPSLSIATPAAAGPGATGTVSGSFISPISSSNAYSPLVPLAAVQAADVMSRMVQRLRPTPATASPTTAPLAALRGVLSTMLARTASVAEPPSLGIAQHAPELVTPPAPRDERVRVEQAAAMQVADRVVAERAKIVEVQRVARQAALRELAAATSSPSTPATPTPPAPTEVARLEAAVRERAVEAPIAPVRPAGAPEPARVESEQARVEQARVEERIAQRVAERTQQRLHEQARAEAAAHARGAIATPAAPVQTPSVDVTPTVPRPSPRVPAEVIAALAALPPELAHQLAEPAPGGSIERTIAQLDETYRAVELLARRAAAGETFVPTRGPRLVMPSGLGGLAAVVARAERIGASAIGASGQGGARAPTMTATPARPPSLRIPAMSWIAPTPSTPPRLARTEAVSALGAAATTAPAAIGHVAWADRWLARFAGASSQTLATLSASTTSDREVVLQNLAAAAPGEVFVSPTFFDAQRDGERVRIDSLGRIVVSPPTAAASPAPSAAPAPQLAIAPVTQASTPKTSGARMEIERFDDDAETPDDVFADIARAASQARTPTSPPPAPATEPAPRTPQLQLVPSAIERATHADSITFSAPTAPGAGFAAQLAASPFAPALRHVLSLPAAASFDVRSLFGETLVASYLANLIAPASEEIEVSARALPVWAEPVDAERTREVPSWDAAYVAPSIAPEARDDVAPSIAPTTVAALAPLQTLRTALLSWEPATVREPVAEPSSSSTPTAPTPSSPAFAPRAMTQARTLLDAMTLPMSGDATRGEVFGESWAAPGMVAERARSYAIAQERSSADLAFDFVTPELVLAARVYGLGPVEAAQAARLSIAGPGQLTAMASTVDRAFLEAMAPYHERATRARTGRAITTAFPLPSGDVAAVVGDPARAAAATSTMATATTAEPRANDDVMASVFGPEARPGLGTAFGVERRAPRGAFLWPSATISALQLDAAGPDGEQSMTVAALELLAAQAVVELGTFTAFAPADLDPGSTGSPGVVATGSTAAIARSGAPAPQRPVSSEPDERGVLGAAAALVPAARRARFDALYLALGRSPEGRTMSPAARAARAVALAGRGEEVPPTARERAMMAWEVLPAVYGLDAHEVDDDRAVEDAGAPIPGRTFDRPDMPALAKIASPRPAGRVSGRGARGIDMPGVGVEAGDDFAIDARPGLASLSARAGRALGAYVTSSPAPMTSTSTSTAPREAMGAVMRVPTAAQEMVQTGRPAGRFGGGEAEIPAWFEAAARKMFESQSGSLGSDISMAELTLINAAPPTQIAASTRAPQSAAPAAPVAASAAPAKGESIDIEKLAHDLYRHILGMMDDARSRNGDPYL